MMQMVHREKYETSMNESADSKYFYGMTLSLVIGMEWEQRQINITSHSGKGLMFVIAQ